MLWIIQFLFGNRVGLEGILELLMFGLNMTETLDF